MTRLPGLYSFNYISYLQSPYHVWFVEMGYPELDVLQYEDGEWWIVQYYNAPVIPALTRWQTVLGPMRNVEIGYGFCWRWARALDAHRKEYLDKEEAKSRAAEEEWEAVERHAEDSAEKAATAIIRNPDLMERIARNGFEEMELNRIAKYVPKTEKVKPKFKGVKV